jgi:hypothetical protein
MEYKDCKNLSNAELRIYQENLKNEFETVKAEIAERFKMLDEMDIEYKKAEAELNKRRMVVR